MTNRILWIGLAAAFAAESSATLVGGSVIESGRIERSAEWSVPVTWGSGGFSALWSMGWDDQSGFAYGSGEAGSNVDVYNAGILDPQSVADASAFIYTSGPIFFGEGETLFFRGAGGLYGAWLVEDLSLPVGPGETAALYLGAAWYFNSAGSDFTAVAAGGAVPEPGGLVLLAAGLGGLALLLGRRRMAFPRT
jgi:hypothetical protein